MLHRHCSDSSPCVIAAKANSSLGETIQPLNQQIVSSQAQREHFQNSETVGIWGCSTFLSTACETNDISCFFYKPLSVNCGMIEVKFP